MCEWNYGGNIANEQRSHEEEAPHACGESLLPHLVTACCGSKWGKKTSGRRIEAYVLHVCAHACANLHVALMHHSARYGGIQRMIITVCVRACA
jgi:ribosomal protein L32